MKNTYQDPSQETLLAMYERMLVIRETEEYLGAQFRAGELPAGVTYSVASFKMYQSTGDFLGNINSNASRYFDLSAAFDLGSGFTLTPHYGYQIIPNQNAVAGVNGPAITDGKAGNYSDYALTLAKDFGNGLVVSLAAVGTDAKKQFYTPGFGNTNRFLGKDTVVLGLKYNF